MDFWAQHKDFILKVLAGLGVFLIALIARNVVYGEDLEDALASNGNLAREVRRMKIADQPTIAKVKANAERLQRNAREMAAQLGWDLGRRDQLRNILVRRTLGYLRRYRQATEEELDRATTQAVQAINDNLNGGFGQLRGTVRDDLVDEANERNIRLEEGIGYENVIEVQPGELLRYLLQLEVAARVCRYAIDERVDGIEEIKIETREREVIPGANPDFLQEYPVRVRFRASLEAVTDILNRLESEAPALPWQGLRMERIQRPRDHVLVELTVLALAADPEVQFEAVKEEGQ